MPIDDMAVMLAKPAIDVGVIAASVPPAMTTSQRPSMMRRAPLPMACVPAAHAVTVFSQGPCHPKRIDTLAQAELAIIIGTRNGDTRRRTLFVVDDDLLFERGDATDAGTDPHAAPRRIGDDVAGLIDGFLRGGDRELCEAIGPPRFLGIGVVERRVEVVYATFAFGWG